MSTDYPVTCQGLKQALDDLRGAVDVESARLIMNWVLLHFGSWVLPGFPPPPENAALADYAEWADLICKYEDGPCFTVLQG